MRLNFQLQVRVGVFAKSYSGFCNYGINCQDRDSLIYGTLPHYQACEIHGEKI